MSERVDQQAMALPSAAEMDVAVQWLLRLRDESVDEHDIAAWLQWYETDERNKQAFDQAQDFWQRSGALATGPEGAARLRRLHAQARPVAGVGSGEMPRSLQHPARSAARRQRGGVGWAVAASMVLALTYLAWSPPADDAGAVIAAVSVPPAHDGVRRTRLPDGSVVELAARSSVAVRYTAGIRLVELRGGEAYFDVAVDRERPFVVVAEGVGVRAVGTAFNVRRVKDEVVVTVAEGTVDVYRAGQPTDPAGHGASRPASDAVRVNAGNEVAWVAGGRQPVVSAVDLDRAISWRQGRLEFVGESLASVIEQVARHTSVSVRVGDAAVGELHYTGTVLTAAADEWLRALPSSFPVRLVNETDGTAVVTGAR